MFIQYFIGAILSKNQGGIGKKDQKGGWPYKGGGLSIEGEFKPANYAGNWWEKREKKSNKTFVKIFMCCFLVYVL